MTVAIADVGCRGRLDLTFAVRDGRTIIRDSYCEVPFKITRLLDSTSSAAAHLILMHCTAGIFGGDDLECSIHVERGACVRITQQSATRIHPSGGRLARQSTHIKVEADAELCLDYDPIIPFAGSRFSQETRIDVAPGSRLTFWECMMAGRIGSNERWQFEELSVETRVEMDGGLLYLDRFSMLPAQQNLSSSWVMGDTAYVGTGLIFGGETAQLLDELHAALPEAGVDLLMPQLAVARVVAANGPDFHRYRQIWRLHAPVKS